MQRLPPEIIAKILTHPYLIGPRSVDIGSSCGTSRKSYFLTCSLICKQFHHLLSTPYYRTMWNTSYNDGSLTESLNFAIKNCWQEDVQLLCSTIKTTSKHDLIFSDSLILAVCEYCSLPKSDNIIESIKYNDDDYCPSLDIISTYCHPSTEAHSDSEVLELEEVSIINLYSAQTPYSQTVEDFEMNSGTSNHIRKRRMSRVNPAISKHIVHDGDYGDQARIILKKSSLQSIITSLLKFGANVHAVNDFSLRRAARYGCMILCNIFLHHGANVTSKNHEAVDFAVSNGHKDVLELLLDSGASPIVALQRACMKSCLDTIKLILTEQSNREWSMEIDRWICKDWEDDAIEESLRLWEVQHYFKKHPLVIASRALLFKGETLEYLCEKMRSLEPVLNLSAQNAFNVAIRYAAHDGQLDAIKILAKHGADLGLALQSACKARRAFTVKWLLSEYSDRFKDEANPGELRLDMQEHFILALRSSLDTDIVDMLMQFGRLGWSDVTNHFFVTPSSHLNYSTNYRSPVPSISDNRIVGEDYSRFSFTDGDRVSISAIVRNLDDQDSDFRSRALQNSWRRQFGGNMI